MIDRAKRLWLALSQSLGAIPGLIVVLFGALAFALIEVDEALDLGNAPFLFSADPDAARTLLSVVAGSLITVAGLTFSITMVVLQLTSSQFSPRILRTFFGDRLTQVTIGMFVGTFAFSLIVLRTVGVAGGGGAVPRLSVTVSSALGISAVILLIVFLHHVSLMIQVSHVMGSIARATLARVDVLYPDVYAGDGKGAQEVLRSWRATPGGRVLPERPGYVRAIGLEGLAKALGDRASHVAVLARAGDFASLESPIAEVWPPEAADACDAAILDAMTIADERELREDVDFGLRQLTDTALKALSPSLNDPTTATTCVGYLRSILARLAEREYPPLLRRHDEHGVELLVARREFTDHLECLLQLGRSVGNDAWVATEILGAFAAVAAVADRVGADERLEAAARMASVVAQQAHDGASSELDRDRIAERLRAVEHAAGIAVARAAS